MLRFIHILIADGGQVSWRCPIGRVKYFDRLEGIVQKWSMLLADP